MEGDRTTLAVTVGPVLAALTGLCLAPLGLLFVYSFFHVDFVSIVPDFSLRNYAQVLSSGSYRYLILKALMSGARHKTVRAASTGPTVTARVVRSPSMAYIASFARAPSAIHAFAGS